MQIYYVVSFPTAQFLLPGYHKSYRLDISDKQGGLLIYIKVHLPSTLLSNLISPKYIEAIPFELNLRKEMWMFVCIQKPPKLESQYFFENLSLIIDHYSSIYDNHIILGDFNMETKSPKLASFMHFLIKSNTASKGVAVVSTLFLPAENTALQILLISKQGLVISSFKVFDVKNNFQKGRIKTVYFL